MAHKVAHFNDFPIDSVAVHRRRRCHQQPTRQSLIRISNHRRRIAIKVNYRKLHMEMVAFWCLPNPNLGSLRSVSGANNNSTSVAQSGNNSYGSATTTSTCTSSGLPVASGITSPNISSDSGHPIEPIAGPSGLGPVQSVPLVGAIAIDIH